MTMVMDFLRKLYYSDFSKKLGIYKNQEFLRLYKSVSDRVSLLHAALCSKKLRFLYSNKKLTTENISRLTYQDLDYLFSYDIDLFKKVSTEIYSLNLERIKTKEKIRVAFFCNTDTVWSCERLYHLFEDDERFEPVVVVPGFNNGTPITIREMYETTVKFFRDGGYRTIGLHDEGSEITSWEEIGIPDLVFHLTPYTNMLPSSVNIMTLPLNTLNVNIPYALGCGEDKWWYNTPGARLSWKQFVETELSKEVINEFADIGDCNVAVFGHPKTDCYFTHHLGTQQNQGDFWEFADTDSQSSATKIIYAPHHSIYDYSVNFSTFHTNYREMYQYAKEHPTSTSWVIKPHPLLKKACVTEGLFESEEAYDQYLDSWNELPNASVVTSGDYTSLFLSSDAMITDSGSFIIEYQYVKKPLIILNREGRTYNVLSKKLLPGLYVVDGFDVKKIYELMDTVFIEKNDYLKETRDLLYDEVLNLQNIGSCGFPSYNIYNYISSLV